MKFKPSKNDADIREIILKDKGYPELVLLVQTRADGKPGLFVSTDEDGGVYLTKKQALKLAWTVIDELNPDVLS